MYYFIWCVSCTVVIVTSSVKCGCFGNMCTCLYCVLYCLYCVFCIVQFMYFYSCLFCLYYCKNYCHWLTTQLQLIIMIIIIINLIIIVIKDLIHFSCCVLNSQLPACRPPHEKLSRPVLSNLSIKTAEKSRTVQSSNLCPRSDRDTTGEGERDWERERERERERVEESLVTECNVTCPYLAPTRRRVPVSGVSIIYEDC
jgi:hypothetical protein